MRLARTLAVVGTLVTLAAPLAAQSTTEGAWMLRVRALSLTPADKSDAIPSLSVPEDAITVSAKIFPDIDIVRFFGTHLAAELVLTYPQEHDVELSGTKIGTFKHLPPTLLAQYHFAPAARFRPYVGAGVNFTLISNVDITVPGVGPLDLESSSVGYAVQVGADLRLAPGKFLNIDIKKVAIGSDVLSGGTAVSAVKVDPWLVSIGYGIRF